MAKKNNSFIVGLLSSMVILLVLGGLTRGFNEWDVKEWFGSSESSDDNLEDSSSGGTNVSVVVPSVSLESDESKIIPTFNPSKFSFTTPAATSSSSFVYRDLEIFENEHITKIGLPVISVSDYTQDCVFSINLITQDTTTESIISTYLLTIEANSYNSNSINNWVYFDVDISVEDGQTLAFGRTSDSVVIACTKTYYAGGTYGEVTNKVCNGVAGDETEIKSLLFFDITKEV